MSQHNPAPPIGRRSRDVEIGGRKYRVHALPPRSSLRVVFRIAKTFGDSVASLLSGGLEVVVEGETLVLGLEEAIGTPKGRAVVLPKLLEGLQKLDGEELDEIVCSLLVGTEPNPALATVNEDGSICLVLSEDELDGAVLGPMELVRLTKVALEVSALPTSADAPIRDGSSAVET